MPPWLPPTGSARLVSSRRHRPLPTFPLPFPVDSRFQQTQKSPRDPEPQKPWEQPRILPIGCPWRGLLVSLRRFHRAAGNIAATEPFISPPPVASRLSEALPDDRVTRLSCIQTPELTRNLGPGTIRRRPQPLLLVTRIPPWSSTPTHTHAVAQPACDNLTAAPRS